MKQRKGLMTQACVGQGSKIALVRSYLRVPKAAGRVKILIFLVKIKFFPIYANNFCDAGQVPILRYFEACRRYLFLHLAALDMQAPLRLQNTQKPHELAIFPLFLIYLQLERFPFLVCGTLFSQEYLDSHGPATQTQTFKRLYYCHFKNY